MKNADTSLANMVGVIILNIDHTEEMRKAIG